MKKILFGGFALLSLLAVSCSKNDSGSTPNNSGTNGSLNATEAKLIGTWFLKKERYILKSGTTLVLDTTYISFPNNPYINFTAVRNVLAGQSFNETAKTMTDKANISLSVDRGSNRGTIASEAPWYFDETSNSLIAKFSNYPYVSINGTQLMLASILGGANDTLWFQKQ